MMNPTNPIITPTALSRQKDSDHEEEAEIEPSEQYTYTGEFWDVCERPGGDGQDLEEQEDCTVEMGCIGEAHHARAGMSLDPALEPGEIRESEGEMRALRQSSVAEVAEVRRVPVHALHEAELMRSIEQPPGHTCSANTIRLCQTERFTGPHAKKMLTQDIKIHRGQLPAQTEDPPYTTETARMVQKYLELAADSFLWPEIQASWDLRNVEVQSRLSAEEHWHLHREDCPGCSLLPRWDQYRLINHLNQCWIRVPLAWFAVGYIPPLKKAPPALQRPNSRTLDHNPKGVAQEVQKMDEGGLASPGHAHTINSMTVVFKDIELYRAQKALDHCAIPYEESRLNCGDYVNERLAEAVASGRLQSGHIQKLKVRLCCDATRTLNDELPHWPFRYRTVHHVVRKLRQGWWMAKIDLTAAFLQVALHPCVRKYYGFRIGEIVRLFNYMIFGTGDAPAACNTLTGLVAGFAARRGITNEVMTDDFIIIAPTFAECQRAYQTFLAMLRRLGWQYGEHKLVPPTQTIEYLGITIDSVNRTLAISNERVELEAGRLQELLQKKTISKHALAKLAGRLQWVATVCPDGRAYISQLYVVMAGLKHSLSRVKMHGEWLQDLQWWSGMLTARAISKQQLWTTMYEGATMDIHRVISDASPHWGMGVVSEGGVVQAKWRQEYASKDSTLLELTAVWVFLETESQWCEGKVLLFTTDNSSTALNINRGTARDPRQRELLKRIAKVAHQLRCIVLADHVLRRYLQIPDQLSKGIDYGAMHVQPLGFAP